MGEPQFPTWVKVYFAVCATLGTSLLALLAWALVAIVWEVTR